MDTSKQFDQHTVEDNSKQSNQHPVIETSKLSDQHSVKDTSNQSDQSPVNDSSKQSDQHSVKDMLKHSNEQLVIEALKLSDQHHVKCTSKRSEMILSLVCRTYEKIPSQMFKPFVYCIHLFTFFHFLMDHLFFPSFDDFKRYILKAKTLDNKKFTNVLVPEDLTLVINYDPNCCMEDKIFSFKFLRQFFPFFGLFALYFIIKLYTQFYIETDAEIEEGLQPTVDHKLFLRYLCILTFLLILVVLYSSMFKWMELLFFILFIRKIDKKVHLTECIKGTIKKCMRLIQEEELIARGFTSASIPGIVERLELSTGLPILAPERQYPELRRYIFSLLQYIFFRHRAATLELLRFVKFDPVIDFSSQYLAALELKEFGDFFKYNVKSDTEFLELLKCTDNFSLSSLNTMYHLAELQISEFYKCLYLKISFVLSESSFFLIIVRIFSDFKICVSRILDDEMQEEVYGWYKGFRDLGLRSKFEEKNAEADCRHLSPFEINMHNMSLHLRSALKCVHDLEEEFELIQDSNQPKPMTKSEKMFKEIKSRMDSCEEHYKKCTENLQNVSYGERESFINNFPQLEISKREIVKPSDIICCDMDQAIEDEIFEAIATKSSVEIVHNFENLSVDRQENNEAVQKLLHELKNVLVVKADEHQAREQLALAKKCNSGNILPKMSSSDTVAAERQDSELKSVVLNEIDNLNLVTSVDKSEITQKTVNNDEMSSSDTVGRQDSELKSVALNEIDNLNLVTSVNKSEITQRTVNNDQKEKSTCVTSMNINSTLNTQSSFAASIAALAIQRQKMLGVLNDAMFSDGNSSEDEENQESAYTIS